MDYAALSSQELVLVCLASGDEAAWTEFVHRFHPLIAAVVFRVCRKCGENSPQIVDDLIQDTYLKLCAGGARLLRNFKPMHPDAIYGYVKVVTANLVHDHFKSLRSARQGGSRVTVSVDADERNVVSLGTRATPALLEREILIRQVDTCLQALLTGPASGRDRKIFWLYYRTGLTASAIASLPGIGLTTKGVESTILRLTRLVRERLCSRAAESNPKAPKGMQPEESF